MTKAEIKNEEYRQLTPFWMARLLLHDGKKKPQSFWSTCYYEIYDHYSFKSFFDNPGVHKITPVPFTNNVMTLGYPAALNKDRIATFEHAGIEIRTGVEDWGAEKGKLYFVIKHGKKL